MKRAIALCMALALCAASFTLPAFAETSAESSEYDVSLSADDYALRGVSWTLTADEVAAIEGVAVDKEGGVTVDEPEIYKVAAKTLSYQFGDDGKLQARVFRLANDDKLYASILISLMMRYGMPYFADESVSSGDKVWVLEDAEIELYHKKDVYVIFRRRADVSYVDEEPAATAAP